MSVNGKLIGDPDITPASGWADELWATIRLAWPLILAQIAQVAFFTTDVVMMGWLGPHYLAAGTLATGLLQPTLVGGIGVLVAGSAMIAQAIGARELKSIRRTVRQSFWIAMILAALIIGFLYLSPFVLAGLRQDLEISAMASGYLRYAAWSVLPALLFMALRNFISAKGNTWVILIITLIAVALNAVFNYGLMFGNFGLPRLELVGAGIATTITNALMFFAALAYATLHKNYRRHYILVRFFKPDWPRFFEFFRIGVPIGLTLLSEVGLFGVAVIMMGWLGPDEIAGHAVAIQCASITFMIPLGLSQATTIRVGLAYGRHDEPGINRAGWSSYGLTLAVMALTCFTFLTFPEALAHLFLDPAKPENAIPIQLAVSYLAIAGLFQVVDGTQVSMASALRGLSDTKVPMIIALIGYWAVGLTTAYVLGFVFEMRGVGIWTGLAAGLAFVGVVLLWRWAMRGRIGLATA